MVLSGAAGRDPAGRPGRGPAAGRLDRPARRGQDHRLAVPRILAPEGLTLTRAEKGKVGITGAALRMSASHLRRRFPDLRLELIRAVFTPAAGADPFPIASAERIQMETRPHLTDGQPATDELDVVFNLVEARGRQGGPVEGATQDGTLTLALEGTVQQASRLTGPNAAGVFSNWSRAGGRFTAVRGELTAGESRALLTSEALTADAAGRLTGELALTAEKPGPVMSGMASSQSGAGARANGPSQVRPSRNDRVRATG
ncbi:MAG: DUF2125 domain-containing protein [Brevundimonas sp.]|nr:MAG: DUF2125 domain-containing protein [Brevundimonas sp.]